MSPPSPPDPPPPSAIITITESKPGSDSDTTGDMQEHVEHDASDIPSTRLDAINGNDLFNVAKNERPQVEAFIERLEAQLRHSSLHAPRITIPPRWFTATMVVFASLGGLLFGLDQSLISGALLFLPHDLHLHAPQESFVSSGVPLGAIAGAVMLIPANEYLGRRRAIIFALALYTIGAALEAGAISYPMMLVGRLTLGFGVGIETGTVPVYVAESVERKYRGNLVSAYQMNIALGEVLGYVVAAIFLDVNGNWRYILGSSVVFSTIMWAGMLILPESPRFLLHKGKQVQAYQVWKHIRGIDTFEAKAEFYVMVRIAETEEREMKAKRAVTKFVWLDFVKVPRARRAIVYANIMILLGQFVGINGIMYYMATLMQQVGFDTADATYMSMVGGAALFLGTIPAIFYMEKFGRRFWAMTMLPGCLIGLALIGANYQLGATTNPAGVQGLYLSGVIVYMLFYGPYACLTWVIPSDVYPTYLRSYGMATSDAMVFLGSFIVTYNFSAMQAAMTKTGLMLGFFGGVTVLGWFYQLFFMPEVKDMTLEEVGIVFSKPTRQLVRENIANTRRTASLALHGRFREAIFRDKSLEHGANLAQTTGEKTEV